MYRSGVIVVVVGVVAAVSVDDDDDDGVIFVPTVSDNGAEGGRAREIEGESEGVVVVVVIEDCSGSFVLFTVAGVDVVDVVSVVDVAVDIGEGVVGVMFVGEGCSSGKT